MIKEKIYILGIIGLGNMGSALLSGVINSGFLKSEEIAVCDADSEKVRKFENIFKVKSFKNLKEIVLSSKYILLAVKPQSVQDILPVFQENCNIEKNVILSIAAGLSTNFFEKTIGDIPVIRIMSNTPALYNKGMSAISSGNFAQKKHMDFTEQLMRSVGTTVLLDEKHQNIATALSGSGPAYFFLFCKLMVDFAVEKGLDKETAKKMVINTMLGAGEVLIKSEKTMDELIRAVTSPGGTTEKALNKFKESNLNKVFFEALSAALNRSVELESVISKK